MKSYENQYNQPMTTKNPVILRIDGRAFHTYTKQFTSKPYNEGLSNAMQETMSYLCKNIDNCILGYTQSDEITLVLYDLDMRLHTPWFNNREQKIVSVAASMATIKFNSLVHAKQFAFFDCRAFTVRTLEEVLNCVYYRQRDAKRNSIQMLARSLFPQRELQGLSTKELKAKCLKEKNINWDTDIPSVYYWGSTIHKIPRHNDSMGDVVPAQWELNQNLPMVHSAWDQYMKFLTDPLLARYDIK